MLRYEQLKENPRRLERCLRAFHRRGCRHPGDAAGCCDTSQRVVPERMAPRTTFGLTDRQLAFVEALAFRRCSRSVHRTDITAAERALDDSAGTTRTAHRSSRRTSAPTRPSSLDRISRACVARPARRWLWFLVSGSAASATADEVHMRSRDLSIGDGIGIWAHPPCRHRVS